MTIINENDTAVMVVDVQEKLINAVFNKELVNKNAIIVVNTAKILNLPTIITEQYPKGLGLTISNIKEISDDTSVYFEKTSFNALNHEDILCAIKNLNRKNIVLFGIETHICVYQTAADLIANGYEVEVLTDCVSSRTARNHEVGVQKMIQLRTSYKC